MTRWLSACVATAACLLAVTANAKPPPSADLVRARTLIFGAENVKSNAFTSRPRTPDSSGSDDTG